MATADSAKPCAEPQLGLYFRDEKRLFWVAGVSDTLVLLEDCADLTLSWWPVSEMVGKLTLVRPQIAA